MKSTTTTDHHACTFAHRGPCGPLYPPPPAVAGTIICFITYSMGISPSWEATRFSIQIFHTFYGTGSFIAAFRDARHSVLLLVFRNHLPELSHITKRDADFCFGRKIMNSVIGIGLQVWKGSCELLRTLKTCLRAVGSTCLFFNMADLVFGTRCV